LQAFRRRRDFVRVRHVVLLRPTVARCRGPAAALAAAPRALAPAATPLAAAAPLRAHGAETFTVALAITAALARRAEAFDVCTAPARLVLLAEPNVLLGVET